MKVDFLIVGAQKSGTSALDRYLREHGDIEMARRREVHFFDDEARFLGVGPFVGVEYRDVHSRPYVSTMTETDRALLADLYHDDVRDLEAMLGWDCRDWLSGSG